MRYLEDIDISEFEDVYHIMEKSFPVEELRVFEEQKRLLDIPDYHIEVVKNEKRKIMGFIAYWKIGTIYFVEHFAVHPCARGTGIGAEMMKEAIKKWNAPVMLEVELPKTEIAKRRIAFYERIGFKQNHFEHFQMPLRKGSQKLPLYMMSFPSVLLEEEFMSYQEILYKTVYKNWEKNIVK